jgi:hypothetical protein
LEHRTLLSGPTIYTVIDVSDSATDEGSLRYAIAQANLDTNPAGSLIQFDPAVFSSPRTITLTGGQLELNNQSTGATAPEMITGPSGGVTINGGGQYRVFEVDAGVTASLSGLTITGGGGVSVAKGGGLMNKGTTSLTDCTLSGNSALLQGGAYGGGVWNTGRVTLNECTINGNHASFGGGGVWSNGTAILNECTISGNNVGTSNAYGDGGGLHNSGTVTLDDCTISGNVARGNAAGLLNSGTATLTNCTVSGNSTRNGNGGGLLNSGTATLTNCTVSGNSASKGNGGGLVNVDHTGSVVTIGNTIVAENTADNGGPDAYGTFASEGHNLIGDPDDSNGFGSDLTGNPMLAPLGYYGGPTRTMGLMVGSPAIDAGSNSLVPPGIATDQRGAPASRIANGTVDIGAFEAQPAITQNFGATGGTVVVNTDTDAAFYDGTTSLRDAIAYANAATGSVTINFDPTVFATAQTITLTEGPLTLSNTSTTETIAGPAGGVTVSGGGLSRVFQVDANVTASISGLTITGGNTVYSGGGLYNNGTITLTNCTISGNIANDTTGNQTDGGGGLYNVGSSSAANLYECIISNNQVLGPAGSGGGVYNRSGTATLTDCTISGNFALGTDGSGGGLQGGGPTVLNDCTLSDNEAGYNGGGLANYGTNITLTNCTISGNSSNSYGGGVGATSSGGTTALNNCTISGNSALDAGGGLSKQVSKGKVTLANTIVAGNTAPSGPDASGTFASGGYNLIGETDGSSKWIDTDRTGTIADPLIALLAPLGHYGGLTETMALEPDSPAIDEGNNALIPSGVTTDQRGLPRIINGTVDIGAFEFQTVKVQVSDVSNVYDGLPFAATATITPNDGTSNNTLGEVGITFTYYVGIGTGGTNLGGTAPTNAGTYTVVASYPGTSEYPPASDSTSFMITPKVLSVSGLSARNKNYDGTTSDSPTGTAALLTAEGAGSGTTTDGRPYSGDNVTLGGTAIGTFASKDVADNISVTVSGNTLGGNQAGDYVLATDEQSGLSADISAKTLFVWGLSASDKTYDATTTATLTGTAALLNTDSTGASTTDGHPYTGDAVSLNSTAATAFTGTFAGTDAAIGIVVKVTGNSLIGAQARDYVLSSTDEENGAVTASIMPKTLFVSGLSAINKVYDATTNATLSGTSSLLSNDAAGASTADGHPYDGDAVSLSSTAASAFTGTFATKDVASGIVVKVTGNSLTGAQAGDYVLSSTDEQSGLTANITAEALTASLTGVVEKTYDGTTAATLAPANYALVGAVGADQVGLNDPASGSYDSKDVGASKVVSVAGLALVGADAGDYALALASIAGTVGQVDAKVLTASLTGVVEKTYDGSTAATLAPANYSLVGAVSGDDVHLTVGGATASFDTKDVGTNKPVTVDGLALAGGDAGSYAIAQPTGLAAGVTPRSLSITGLSAEGKTYDGTTAAVLNTAATSLVGVIAGDDVHLDASQSAATFATRDVGTGEPVTVTGLALAGTDAGDYALEQPTGLTADITPAPLTVTAIDRSMTYGGTVPALTFDTGPLAPGDTVGTALSGSMATTAGPRSPVGADPITQGTLVADPDYAMSFTAATLTIDPATLTITADDQSKTYGRALVLDGTGFTSVGLIDGDAVAGVTLTSAGAAATADVTGSPYLIAPADATGTGLGNYAISYIPGTLTVLPAPLTATALDAGKSAGQANPSFSVAYSGFVLGQGPGVLDGSLTFTTTAAADSPAGSYPIVPGGLTSPDYAITFIEGTLTVTPAPGPSPTPTTTPSPTPSSSPPVTVAGLLWETVKAGRKKSARELVIRFSGALNPGDANDLAAYSLRSAKRQKKATAYIKPVPLISASYNAAGDAVTLLLRGKLHAQAMQLTIDSALVLDAEGRELDGDHDGRPGGNVIATLNNQGVISMATQAGARVDRVASAVDSLMADGSFAGMIRREHGHR